VVADVDTLDHLYLRVISPLVGAFVVIAVVTLGLCVLDVPIALTLGGIMLLTLMILPPLFYRAGKSTGENLTRLRGEYRQQLTSWLQGQAELTLFGASKRYRARMESTELNWHEAQRRQSELTAFSQALMMLIGGVAVIAMLWMASGGVGDNSQPGALIALFVFCALAAFEALAPVTGAFQHLGQVIASALRITEIAGQEPEVTFRDGQTVVPERVTLTLNDVTFAYDKQAQNALEGINLVVNAGQRIALLGRTGCGKSTLLQLLTRAWDPQQGQILLNNVPLADFSEQTLRKTVSVVPQRVHLFSATLRDNLLLAAPDASDALLSVVLEQVGLHKLLEDDGLNSWLGEGGRQLSGGELRRLAIARALLHDAPLMLLDEPTEGLDATTESQILDLLATVMAGKTVLMVTHRLRGLASFDQIIVMDNGHIIEHGSHAELLAKQGRYYQFKQRL
jgi:ATP-binding cassette subfamily C protein CydC